MRTDPATLDVVAPNFKRRWSGVSSTVIRLVPLQARDIAIAATGPRLPDDVPRVSAGRLLTMSRSGPHGARVWHARRNIEMLAGLLLRGVLRKRLKLVFTSASQREHTRWSRWLISRMDRVVATSRKTARYLRVPHVVIHHGIDLTGFAPPEDRRAIRTKLGLSLEHTLVGCYGRIRDQKGTGLFVDAMIALLPERPECEALVMGATTASHRAFLEGLREKVKVAGLEPRIHFLPEVPGWEIAPWFQAIDLYVAPQRHEGFGLTPLESMACGTPVVATTAGAFEELVVHEGTGLIVPVNDAPALQAAIARALDNPEERQKWGAAGPAHVAAHFRLEDEAAALNAIYRELLGIG